MDGWIMFGACLAFSGCLFKKHSTTTTTKMFDGYDYDDDDGYVCYVFVCVYWDNIRIFILVLVWHFVVVVA